MVSTGRWSYGKKTGILILFISLIRIVFAFTLDLGNDEAYYWLYSQQLQWNYFDHPPLVALWTKIFTLNLSLDSPGFLRIGSIVACALSSLFLYKTVAIIHSSKAGFYAACLYNASLYAGLTAGIYLMPDAPQMVFWTFCLWQLMRIIENEKAWSNWILFGIGAGLCIMSKVHGIFIWFGLGLFILFKRKTWLRLPQLYVAMLFSVVIVSPILFWNIANDFATYRFHSQRVALEDAPFNRFAFPREVLHQVVWNNPINVILIFMGIIAWRRQTIKQTSEYSLFLFIGLPLALSLLFISIFRDTVLPHWSGPAYVSLLPFAAAYLAGRKRKKWAVWSLGLFITILIGWLLLVRNYPGNLGKNSAENYGQGDITLDQYGWKEAGKAFSSVFQSEMGKGLATEKTPLVCTYWWGAHVEYYFARPLQLQMIGFGSMAELHHYLWKNASRREIVIADTAYYIMPSDDHYGLPTTYYRSIKQIATITTNRGRKPAHYFRVYRLSGLQKPIPFVE